MRCRMLLVVLAGAALVAPAAQAQDAGEVAGTVVDASGGVVPGVTVTINGPVLLQPQTALTSAGGTYRFPRVAIGTYSVTFELPGFTTVVREGVIVEIGLNVIVDATLAVANIAEKVSVEGENPVVDTRSTTRDARFTRPLLDSVPTSRDVFAILALTPGTAFDRVNVAGALCGQCQAYASRGYDFLGTVWTLDGVDITDVSGGGHSPVEYDFDSFQEMQIATDSGGMSRMTGGIGINLVTKSGTDAFRGSARYLGIDEALQAENLDTALRQQGAGSGNPIQNLRDYGIEAGGPLKRGRAWFWGSYGGQMIKSGVVNYYKDTPECAGLSASTATDYPLETLRDCRESVETNIRAANLKAQVQLRPKNKLTWFNSFTEKVQPNAGASSLRPPETTNRVHGVPGSYGTTLWTTGPTSIWRASDQHVFSDRWLLEVQWAHVGNNFVQDFHDPGLADVQPQYEITTGEWARSYARALTMRPADSVDIGMDYFRPSWLGGDHAIKAAWRWRQGSDFTEYHEGGNTHALYWNGAPAEAQLWRDSQTGYHLDTQAAWVQDTYTRRGLTLNLGLRWDRQHDSADASSVPSHPFQGKMTAQGVPFDWLPAATFAGADSGVVWNDFSPRAGAVYDVTGDGRNLAKASYGRYYRQLSSIYLSQVLNTVTPASISFPWSDLNGDDVVQIGEIDTSQILDFSGNYDPWNPGFPASTGSVDSGIKNETTDEIVLGFEREVGAQFGMGVSYIWRKYNGFPYIDTIGMTSADWVKRTFTPKASACPAGARCETVEYWEPAIPFPAEYVVINQPDTDRRYQGVEITARRRASNRWGMNGSLTFNDTREYYRSADAYEDPTNVDSLNGLADAQWAPDQSVTVNGRWLGKLSGFYMLPWWEIALAGFYQVRQGHAFAPGIRTPSRANYAGTIVVLLDPMGDVRLPVVQTLDASVTKPLKIGRLKATLIADVFNLTNENTVLRRARVQNASTANNATIIIGPRVARFGIRLNW